MNFDFLTKQRQISIYVSLKSRNDATGFCFFFTVKTANLYFYDVT